MDTTNIVLNCGTHNSILYFSKHALCNGLYKLCSHIGGIKATMLVRDVHTYFTGGGSKFLGNREDGDAYLSDGGFFI